MLSFIGYLKFELLTVIFVAMCVSLTNLLAYCETLLYFRFILTSSLNLICVEYSIVPIAYAAQILYHLETSESLVYSDIIILYIRMNRDFKEIRLILGAIRSKAVLRRRRPNPGFSVDPGFQKILELTFDRLHLLTLVYLVRVAFEYFSCGICGRLLPDAV